MLKIKLTKQEKMLIKSRIKEIDGVLNEPSTQNMFPFSQMTKDGIAIFPHTYFDTDVKAKILSAKPKNFYSVSLKFSDINYQLASDEEQNAIFSAYSEILNYFDNKIYFQLTFESKKKDIEKLSKKINFAPQNDGFNELREEFSNVIKNNLLVGNNGNEIIKFLTFGIFADNLKDAKTQLNQFSEELIAQFKKAGGNARKIG